MKTKRCYLYTRVSTAIQVDGFSLEAQREKLRKYAEFQEMVIAGEYCDEGKSGKNIQCRPEFQRMLQDIEDGKWYNVTATVKHEFWADYKGVGPVLYITEITPADAPKEEIINLV